MDGWLAYVPRRHDTTYSEAGGVMVECVKKREERGWCMWVERRGMRRGGGGFFEARG